MAKQTEYEKMVAETMKRLAAARKNNMVSYSGYDRRGIVRVVRTAEQAHDAFAACYRAVCEYVQRNPHMGPIAAWLVERAEP